MTFFLRNVKAISIGSELGLVYFIVIILGMHKLRPDYNPISRYISEYAIGKYGKIAASSFAIYGLSILGVGLSLRQTLVNRDRIDETGLIFMAVWGICGLVSSFFKVDLKCKPFSLKGAIHTISTIIGLIASILSLICFSHTLSNTASHNDASILYLAWMSGTMAILELSLGWILFLGYLGDLSCKFQIEMPRICFVLLKCTGIVERSILISSVYWLMRIAFWMIRRG
ncbi:hypothetical protein DEAC_c00560 [Desulfosporosinus acididurans]|uniref:DUF998 domain-containing protein n=1 Tax=Desulfosporosinus acididurans TaxID=476652 RepID=A0A0J1FWJ0_9FIRM|nr:DUF998 domain-containing protein [Desulfosporosinus acididurans]KLU67662.1 hypothetical protein DEAC_c00560 [Desulfosporosinus acididurans]